MKQYGIKLTGLTPLLMHRDNLSFSEMVGEWIKDPANNDKSVKGDDRTPPWRWIGYLYHDGDILGMAADNLMSMLRDGGSKVKTGNRAETFKKKTQSGLMMDQQQFKLLVNGKTIKVSDIEPLLEESSFVKHLKRTEELGFELNIKRAKINKSKHVRVRPMFRTWELQGSLTVIDPEFSGITTEVLNLIFNQAGALCGLGDWRPNSPFSPGVFGKFKPEIKEL